MRRPHLLAATTTVPARARARLALGLVALAVLGGWLALAAAASATDYTWSGGGGSGADAWSNGANWLGGVAPAPESSIGTLTFPKLAAGAASKNDLTGLSVEQLQLDNSHGLRISGDGLTLGSGGLSLSACRDLSARLIGWAGQHRLRPGGSVDPCAA
jgi:adhesin HecA-like repeat protein